MAYSVGVSPNSSTVFWSFVIVDFVTSFVKRFFGTVFAMMLCDSPRLCQRSSFDRKTILKSVLIYLHSCRQFFNHPNDLLLLASACNMTAIRRSAAVVVVEPVNVNVLSTARLSGPLQVSWSGSTLCRQCGEFYRFSASLRIVTMRCCSHLCSACEM